MERYKMVRGSEGCELVEGRLYRLRKRLVILQRYSSEGAGKLKGSTRAKPSTERKKNGPLTPALIELVRSKNTEFGSI